MNYFLNNILVFIHHVKIIGYSSERHGVIDHCDRRITLLSDTDISFGLFNPFSYFDMPVR